MAWMTISEDKMDYKLWLENKTIPCGECFSFANNFAREMLDDGIIPEDEIKVVHGMVEEPMALEPKRYAHAWIEVQGKVRDWQMRMSGKHFLPIKDFYKLYKPTDIKKYTVEESMVNMLKYKHHGPWEG